MASKNPLLVHEIQQNQETHWTFNMKIQQPDGEAYIKYKIMQNIL